MTGKIYHVKNPPPPPPETELKAKLITYPDDTEEKECPLSLLFFAHHSTVICTIES